jgi:GDP-D-mannose dehydratase
MQTKIVTSFITGVGGFVASHLARYLLEQGETVYGTYRWNEDLSRLKDFKKGELILIPMDLNDLSSCIKAIKQSKPDYIFHLAAQSYVGDSFDYPEETIRTNTIGTLKLLEAVRIVRQDLSNTSEYGIVYDDTKPTPGTQKSLLKKDGDTMNLVNVNASGRFDPVVHVCSSSEVYGLVKKEDIPIKESQQFNPSNPYAVGKVGEDMVALMYWTNYGIKTIRTRMFTHTGPGRTMMSAECNFARQIALIEKGEQDPVISHGNLDSIRTWADVRDAVRAYYLLVRKCKPGEVYNIGGNTAKTIGEMLKYLISISIYDNIKTVVDPKLLRPYDVTLQIPDCSKFINETGWKPLYTFEQTMCDLLDWWRKNA